MYQYLDVSVVPKPPAADTAAASSGTPRCCIPPCITGYRIPSNSVILVFMLSPSLSAGFDFPAEAFYVFC